MEIKSISNRIFQPAKNKVENNSSQTNPFGVNFKGKMITADVFEPAASKLSEKVANKGKLLTSAIVGSINDVNEAIGRRLNSVVEFGRRIRENTSRFAQNTKNNISEAWSYLNDTKLVMNIGNSEPLLSLKRVNNSWNKEMLRQKNVSELEEMFTSLINTRIG